MENEVESTQKPREIVFDIAKGIAIILVVMAHAGFKYTGFIYLFHMAFFFILSGYFFKDKYYESFDSVKTTVISRFKTLCIPYIVTNLIFLCLHNFFCHINIYTNNPDFLKESAAQFGLIAPLSLSEIFHIAYSILILNGGTQLGGATWFLKAMFYVTLSFILGNFAIKKFSKDNKVLNISIERFRFLLCGLCLLIGYILDLVKYNRSCIGIIFTSIGFYYIGTIFKKYKISQFNFWYFLLSFIILLVGYHFHVRIELSENYYPNLFLLIILSIAGFVFVIFLSQIVNKINFAPLQNTLSYIGQHTISILCLHFLFFKIVTYYQIIHYSSPAYMLASFPTFINTEYWWLIYSIVGIIGPLIIMKIYSYISLKENRNLLNFQT